MKKRKETRGPRKEVYNMVMLTPEMAKKQMELAHLTPSLRVGTTDEIIVMVKKERRDSIAIAWGRFFAIMERRNLAVFIDERSGYMKIMGKRNQKVS